MKLKAFLGFLALLIVGSHPFSGIGAGKKPPAQKSWGYVSSGPVEVRRSPSKRKSARVRLERGALVPVFEFKPEKNPLWTRLRVVQPSTLEAQMGWVEFGQIEILPLDQIPSDATLLKQLDGVYLDDFTASRTQIARFLVRAGGRDPALVCFLGSPVLPQSRLQVFRRSKEGFVPGPYLEFPFSDMKAGITALEVRDLLGSGNECLVTHEPFHSGPEDRGVNLVIRHIEDGALKILWQAPLEHRNLASFPPRLRVLAPPEKNIGLAGTVTTGSVDFRPSGKVHEPVWRGKIEFFAVGREEPVETVTVEKVCAWDGEKFKPLR